MADAFPTTPTINTGDKAEDIQTQITNFVSDAIGDMSLTESWSVSDLLNGNGNISLNMDVVDKALAPTMEKVDKAMNALCQ